MIKTSLRIIALVGFALFMTACQHRPPRPNTSTSTSAIVLPSRLPLPIRGISRKQLTDTWGAARANGARHEGIDIMAAIDTPVYATTDGSIAGLKGNPLGGNVIWLKADDGSWHYYAHLNRHAEGLAVGDTVRVGTLIGYVGNSGNARYTAPHLHYAIYVDGRGKGAVNPYLYLR